MLFILSEGVGWRILRSCEKYASFKLQMLRDFLHYQTNDETVKPQLVCKITAAARALVGKVENNLNIAWAQRSSLLLWQTFHFKLIQNANATTQATYYLCTSTWFDRLTQIANCFVEKRYPWCIPMLSPRVTRQIDRHKCHKRQKVLKKSLKHKLTWNPHSKCWNSLRPARRVSLISLYGWVLTLLGSGCRQQFGHWK